jgi:2'-5' RNA ligase
MKRTFIAVKVKPEDILLEAVYSLRDRLANENIKWTDFFDLHITLAFIGGTDGTSIMNIKSMLQQDLSGFGNIEFELSGFGVFRNIRDPKVIFAQVENTERLAEAHAIIKKGLDTLNIKIEERDFQPHLTLGRIKYLKDRANLQELINEFRNQKFQDVIVDEVIFYESILQSTGPKYEPLNIIRLDNSRS